MYCILEHNANVLNFKMMYELDQDRKKILDLFGNLRYVFPILFNLGTII